MTSKFKLSGLSKPKSLTCEPLNNENIFWVTSTLSQDRFDALWKYWKDNHCADNLLVEIEHDGLREDGTPINPTFKSILNDK